MNNDWFPKEKEELEELLDRFIIGKKKKVHGLIVPHAGYQFSGNIAGVAFGKIKEVDRVVIFGPSHHKDFFGIQTITEINTPLGKAKILPGDFEKIKYEHSVVNEVPFLQSINPDVEILPLVVGVISKEESKDIAKDFENFNGLFIFSTDLSHFLKYDEAVEVDMRSISLIEDLKVNEVDACGKYPLMIMQELCKLKGWRPERIDYKNSGDVSGEKESVVGYASFEF